MLAAWIGDGDDRNFLWCEIALRKYDELVLDRLRIDEFAQHLHHRVDASEWCDALCVELHAIASFVPWRVSRMITPSILMLDERSGKQGRTSDEKLIIIAKLRLPNWQNGNRC